MLADLASFWRRTLRNMWQSPLLCLAAVGTMAFSLAIMAMFIVLVLNVQKLTGVWSKDLQVVIYLQQPPDESQLQTWTREIGRNPEVSHVTYVSPADALDAFKKRLGADQGLLDGVEETVLPASLEISLSEHYRTPAGLKAVVARLKGNKTFADLRYGQDWLERFESFVRLLKGAGAVLGGFLIFATLFIVSNTIKLTLYARREELEIMALVGATSRFIKTPFLLEGALQGAVGGALALGGVFCLFQLFLRDGLSSFLLSAGVSGISFLPWTFQLGVIATGVVLGFFGSLFSLRRMVRF